MVYFLSNMYFCVEYGTGLRTEYVFCPPSLERGDGKKGKHSQKRYCLKRLSDLGKEGLAKRNKERRVKTKYEKKNIMLSAHAMHGDYYGTSNGVGRRR